MHGATCRTKRNQAAQPCEQTGYAPVWLPMMPQVREGAAALWEGEAPCMARGAPSGERTCAQ